MKNPLYITSHGILSRKDNTLYFINETDKKQIPIHAISEINCFGKVSLKSGASTFLMKEGIVVNFFNKYGFYEGSLYPKIKLNSGLVVVRQSEHYLDVKKRQYIAKEFVEGIKHNILKTMKYYSKKGKNLDEYIENIEKENIDGDIAQMMSCEGRIWNNFYQSFNVILRKFPFNKREIRPPIDEINSLLSFGNSLLYTTVLSELYQTYLHPSVSFLHEPSERRFSLSLDFADIFKPIIVDRTIFKLVNNNMLSKKHFTYDVGCLLNDKGKQIFISEYQKKLETTIMHQTLNKKVSYKYLIRLEGYKLIKHFLKDKQYESFKMWW
ncbi:type I-B CRISPR-associated endonuclease Cas1b [Methanobrevibacter sp.]|uniref:type I-B CRISPR-associated endonuclease Cas1b n=1 Tax=Methanobrevibacter sp. TaxID=66852 RepID=UPI0026DFDFA2|nr:type I-B CRISPR-associated endonuclease Cas1b [Methanobrevibacter sp.]MDO5824554.1 type I-B CRISPR-associated endonuclease Cas1b [Methanobrevibacter sp.]